MNVPTCSECAQWVEWRRFCKSSKWRLFQGRPDILTDGEYFRIAEGTPAPKDGSWLWSRDWITDDLERQASDLGEWDGPEEWRPGELPAVVAIDQRIGREGCCTGGAIYPAELLPEANWFEGFPTDCLVPPLVPWEAPFPAWCERQNLLESTVVLSKLAESSDILPQVIQAWLGPLAIVDVVLPGDEFFPGTAIAQLPSYTVVFIAGSSSTTQLVFNALNVLNGPNFFTGYPGNGIWWEGTMEVLRRIRAAGVLDITKPIALIGHSYGGVIATLIGDTYAQATPERSVRVVGFGVPKCVGTALRNRNVARPWCYIANMGDPVVDLPPGILQLGPLSLLIPIAVKLVWARWAKPGNQTILYSGGEMVADNGSCFFFWQLAQILAEWSAGDPITVFDEHDIISYFSRLDFGP